MWRRLVPTFLRSRAQLLREHTEALAERDRALHMAVESNNVRLEMAGLIVRLKIDLIGLQARLDAREVLLQERERKIKRLNAYRVELVRLQGEGVLQ